MQEHMSVSAVFGIVACVWCPTVILHDDRREQDSRTGAGKHMCLFLCVDKGMAPFRFAVPLLWF